VLQSMLEHGVADNAALRGQQLSDALRKGLATNPDVVEVRHLGLLVAIQMIKPCQGLVALALEKGLLINVTAESVIRLLPSLVINEAETTEISDILIDCIHQFTG
jgi:acetylornithine/N-succinyldiaminopimelate aminotransferase